MKVTWSLMSPFPTPYTCPLPIMCITRVPLERSPRRFHRKEAQPWFDQPFDEPVVLLDQGIEVFPLPQFDLLRKESSGFELGNG
jgi:hypothetical protein